MCAMTDQQEVSLKEHFDTVIGQFQRQSSAEHDEVKRRLGKVELKLEDVDVSLSKGGERIGAVEQELAANRAVKDDRAKFASGTRNWMLVVIAVVGIVPSVLALRATSEVKSISEQTQALCSTKYQSLDASRSRGTYTDTQYLKQLELLAQEGCTRK